MKQRTLSSRLGHACRRGDKTASTPTQRSSRSGVPNYPREWNSLRLLEIAKKLTFSAISYELELNSFYSFNVHRCTLLNKQSRLMPSGFWDYVLNRPILLLSVYGPWGNTCKCQNNTSTINVYQRDSYAMETVSSPFDRPIASS